MNFRRVSFMSEYYNANTESKAVDDATEANYPTDKNGSSISSQP
jgi:hypothetical protein